MEQGSTEWLETRAGKITASRIGDLMAKGRGDAPSKTRETYIAELVSERLTGKPASKFTNAHMERGTELEPQAREAYAFYGGEVDEIAFVEHPSIKDSGASPDGLVEDDGLVEIKCPKASTHLATLRGATIDKKYRLQMQWQMACTGRDWCDFVSYHPDFPEALALHTERVRRDDKLIAEIEEAVRDGLSDVASVVEELMQAAA